MAYPNDDTLYSTAFLDLRAGPQLLSVPRDQRTLALDLQLLDMYTNTIADVGVLTGGGHARRLSPSSVSAWRWHHARKVLVRIDAPRSRMQVAARTYPE